MIAFSIVMLIFFVLLVMGVPIAVALGVGTVGGLIYSDISLGFISQLLYTSVDSFPLLAVPLFILAGYLMETGGISRRIIEFARSLIGTVRGGLALVTVMACVIFAAISGSSPATVAAIGAMMIPAMMRQGYDKHFAGAVTASGGSLGILIPPSIPLIIYAVSAEVSTAKIFLAGIVPGLLIGAGLLLVVLIMAPLNGGRREGEPISLRRIGKSFYQGLWSLITPVIVLGGIYGGIFTPTESAVVAVVYAIVIGMFVYRELKLSDLYRIILLSAVTSGAVLLIFAFAMAFARFMTLNQVPQGIADAILSITDNKFLILALFMLMVFITGMFMETIAQILIYTPLFLPVLMELGVDPIHFGIILVVGTELGLLTPPVGMNLFVVKGMVSQIRMWELSVKIMPFVLSMLIVQILLAYVPAITMFLPEWVYPGR